MKNYHRHFIVLAFFISVSSYLWTGIAAQIILGHLTLNTHAPRLQCYVGWRSVGEQLPHEIEIDELGVKAAMNCAHPHL